MVSAAERYSKFKRKQLNQNVGVDSFLSTIEIVPDDFQLTAFNSIEHNRSVLVAAPTGSGKTLIAEFGIFVTRRKNSRIFYTTPIKALSNQKYRDFCDQYGEGSVGLLTGDRKINPDADIIVMTTEILRNMLYSDQDRLDKVTCVVMDEVHYLSDRNRGSVWEESFILLPESIQVICLSATVSNAEEFGDWLNEVRANVDVVVSEKRPIPLKQLVAVNGKIHDLFLTDKKNAKLILNPSIEERATKSKGLNRSKRFSSMDPIQRVEVIEQLFEEGKLPCIYFIFSRKGCDKAASEFLLTSDSLVDKQERSLIQMFVESKISHLSEEDLAALDYDEFIRLLEYGVATHHAGMIPLFKEIVEELFQANLVKLVFATETLSLGINMPAKTVVIESLRKFDGSTHVDLTAGEFTQLTGRAGRRGLDQEGFAVVPISETTSAATVANLASTRTYPLRSSFKPNYNMSINLVSRYGRERGIAYLEKSFAQYQAKAMLKKTISRLFEIDKAIADLSSQYSPQDIDLAIAFIELNESFERVKNEQLINRFQGGHGTDLKQGAAFYFAESPAQIHVITDVNFQRRLVSTISIQDGFRKLDWGKFSSWPIVFSSVRIPKGFNPNDRVARKKLLDQISPPSLVKQDGNSVGSSIGELQDIIERHPFQSMSNRNQIEKVARRIITLERERIKVETKIDKRAGSLAKSFNSICDVLQSCDYLDSHNGLTLKGEILAGIYAESDLLLTESISLNLFQQLTIPELGAVLSSFVFESRLRFDVNQVSVPTKNVRDVLIKIEEIYYGLDKRERDLGFTLLRPIDAGFAIAVYDWLSGEPVSTILEDSDLSPGDFVRWIKQIMDLSNQLISADVDAALKKQCYQLRKALDYGIVNASEIDLSDIKGI